MPRPMVSNINSMKMPPGVDLKLPWPRTANATKASATVPQNRMSNADGKEKGRLITCSNEGLRNNAPQAFNLPKVGVPAIAGAVRVILRSPSLRDICWTRY